jgi:pimeloyl-ACP methyl ester carboxylesterase
MSAIIIDGKLLHYETFGRGKPLIFVHGWLGSWRYWVPTMEIMSEYGRTYALDLWGYGDSDKANGEYSVARYVNLLDTFVEEMGFPTLITLIGHALGAAIAMRYTADKPERVERVITVSTPLTGDAINPRLLDSGSSFVDRMRGWKPSEGHAEVEQGMNKMAQGVMEASVRSTMNTDLQRDVSRIQVPLLLIYGEKDAIVAPPKPECLANAGENVRAIVLPNARHFLMLDDTLRFTRLLSDFLEVQNGGQLAALTVKEEWRRRTH